MPKKIYNTVDRILQFIEYKSLSKREFAKKIGVSHSLIGKSNNIGSDKLERIISNYPELNPRWLITGVGKMIQEDDSTKEETIDEMINSRIDHKIDGVHDEISEVRKELMLLAKAFAEDRISDIKKAMNDKTNQKQKKD
ncbi:hypothetical protein ACE939_04560 [Aquimarina sp. W85]|uniref:hypothetical protein n=1 Tax=Aquimarina rhodophyticola TaxID=3342246 RepID=UPI003670508E